MPELPSGTVTFLFTDIEGSTALWERDRTAMEIAVERHLALLRTSIAAHDGALFKVVGDAVRAAFLTAPETVSAVRSAGVPDRPACCLAGTHPSREDAQVAECAQKVSSE